MMLTKYFTCRAVNSSVPWLTIAGVVVCSILAYFSGLTRIGVTILYKSGKVKGSGWQKKVIFRYIMQS